MAATQTEPEPRRRSRPPAPGPSTPTHTDVSFTARHLMVTKVRGRFPLVERHGHDRREPARVVGRGDRSTSPAVDSGDAGRDEHLRTADFFDVEHHPTVTFRSTKVDDRGRRHFTLTGDLTIKDVTRPVTLDARVPRHDRLAVGRPAASASAPSTEVSRKDWGLEWNVALEAGGVRRRRQGQAQHRRRSHPPEVTPIPDRTGVSRTAETPQ